MRRKCPVFAVLLLAVAQPGFADSDGYFCIGPDYFAYEMWLNIMPEPAQLYVLRFDDAQTWKEPATIALPEQKNKGAFSCTADRIKVASWDTVHEISWDETRTLKRNTYARTPSPPPGFEYPDTIGSLTLERIPLERSLPDSDPKHDYRLRVVPDSPSPCVEQEIRSYIEQTEQGVVVDTLELYVGTLPPECGD